MIALGNEAGMGNSSSQAGNATCVLLAKEGCVKALLKQAHHSLQRTSEIRVLALRGLSAICCVAQCIGEFEKVSVEINFLILITKINEDSVRFF